MRARACRSFCQHFAASALHPASVLRPAPPDKACQQLANVVREVNTPRCRALPAALPHKRSYLAHRAALSAQRLPMTDVEALPPLATAPLPPLGDSPPPSPPRQPTSATSPSQRIQRHTASSRLHAAVDPESDSAAAIRALLRRDVGDGSRLPQLGAGAGDYVRRNVENMRDLVAKKRQVHAVDGCRVAGSTWISEEGNGCKQDGRRAHG